MGLSNHLYSYRTRLVVPVIVDLFDRKIIGRTFSDNLSTEVTITSAWKMAVPNSAIKGQLIELSSTPPIYQKGSQWKTSQAKYEQERQLLGQCGGGKLLENPEMLKHDYFSCRSAAKSDVFEFIEI